jgi:beta-glucanase (GH16 family)
MRRRALPAALALVLASCGIACAPGVVPSPTPPGATTTTTTLPGEPLLWSDDFTAGLNSTWGVHDDTYGSGGHILSGNSPAAVTVSGGMLHLTASRTPTHGLPFQGAIIGTRETGHWFPRYGRFEARMRLPSGQGLWPAFWLRHRNGSSTAEVDVMEWFYAMRPTATTATLHLDGHPNVSKHDVTFDPSVFHTWAVEIRPDTLGVRFTFTLDGQPYHTYVDTQHAWTSAPADGTWDIALDFWVGGSWIGSPDGPLGTLGNGTKVPTAGLHLAQLPATMDVDWVKVWS